MVSFFKKRSANRNSGNFQSPTAGNGSVGKSAGPLVNDYILKSSDGYVDPSTVAIIKSSSGIPLSGALAAQLSASGGNVATPNGHTAAGNPDRGASGSSRESTTNGRTSTSGSSRDNNNHASSSHSPREHPSNHNNSINSNSSLRNSSNSSSEDGNNNQSNSHSSRRNPLSKSKTKITTRESIAYTEKDIFPNGVRRELKGIMLMGEGHDDVIRRARTYIDASGELHFTLEDLDQYMLPNDFDDSFPSQLFIPSLYPMSRHGFEADDNEEDLQWESEDESAEPNGLSSWTPKSPEVLSQQHQTNLSKNGLSRPSTATTTTTTPTNNVATKGIQLIHPQIEITVTQPQLQKQQYYSPKTTRSSDDDAEDEQLQTKYIMELAANQEDCDTYQDLDTEAIDLKTEDISKIDSIHVRTDYNLNGEDNSSQNTEDDSFSDIMNDYHFFSNSAQNRRSSSFISPVRSRSNSAAKQQPQQYNNSRSKSIKQLEEDDGDTSSYDSDTISEDDYKLLSIRDGHKVNVIDEVELDDADNEDEEREELVPANIHRKQSIINYFNQNFMSNSLLEKERQEKERLDKERIEKESLLKQEKERVEKERLEQEKERIEKERAEKERLEKLEKERLEKERLEKERLEQEKTLDNALKSSKHMSMDLNDVDLLESLSAIIDSPLASPVSSNPIRTSASLSASNLASTPTPISVYRKESSASSINLNLHSKSSIDDIFDDIFSVAKDRRFSISTSAQDLKASMDKERQRASIERQKQLEEERKRKAIEEQRRKEEENQRKLYEVEMERQRRHEANRQKKKMEQESLDTAKRMADEKERAERDRLETEKMERDRAQFERMEKERQEEERYERERKEADRLLLLRREQEYREMQQEFEEERRRVIEMEQENLRIENELERHKQEEEEIKVEKHRRKKAEDEAAIAARNMRKEVEQEIEHLSHVLLAQSLLGGHYGSIRLKEDDVSTQRIFDKMKELEAVSSNSDSEDSSSYSDDEGIQEYQNPTKIFNIEKNHSPFLAYFNNNNNNTTNNILKEESSINYVSDDDFLTSSSEETELTITRPARRVIKYR